ncbi:site-specific integrase [Pseudoalteromonas sp. NZS11_1]|uniref:site-specific integrase n=1 Tax=Pseudoalteromonas sp. NZS11_1 TaxID=2792070 RepID=UPI0018CF7549|nr:site-specific integrase [Pseudoalteromonas sp. NZS11_1]MBH0044865.1 site-specific integrase [Pseudoalteromonas sp. NZS11_1]
MCKQLIPDYAETIDTFLTQSWPLSTSRDDIIWVLQNSSFIEKQARTVGAQDLRLIKKLINTIPTGKKRAYRLALDGVLFYLGSACQWQVPEKIESAINDANNKWFEDIAKGSAQAQRIFSHYTDEKQHFIKTRTPLTPCFMALVLGYDVAPLSLTHITAILNNPDSITNEAPYPRLRVNHITSGSDEQRVTHYHLPLMTYRILKDYYAQSLELISTKALCTSLTQYLHSHGLLYTNEFLWPKLFQISWYLRFKLPPIFIKDLAYPERHVGLSNSMTASNIKEADIYAINWNTNWFDSLTKLQKRIYWTHEILLKDSENWDSVETPLWDANNILPRLLFDYTKQLLLNGGVKKFPLALGSIKNYTSLKSKLEPYPLCYADAISENAVNTWAKKVYDSIDSNNVKATFYRFLRFLSYQEQTDTLDLELFSPPFVPPSVSPARLDVDECDLLIKSLIDNQTNHPLRSLFCAIAALLGFYAMLRRGEVLRLRRKDTQFTVKSGLLTVTVTNTAEGTTKSKKSRKVYTVVPQQYRPLFIYLFEIKKGSPRNHPLLGFEGEKYQSRQLYYLLPVSRALRFFFGTHLNFHHLRHSGVHIFMLQTLHCVSDTPDEQRGQTPLEREVLSSESVARRFNYWLEDREVREVNDAVFLDQMGLQIGHIHYSTTRWSYLHDIDWLLPIISRAHTSYTQRNYTHSELRYLLGLKSDSNDLPRKLIKLSRHYDKNTLDPKHNEPILPCENDLRKEVFIKEVQANITRPTVDHASAWMKSVNTSNNTLLGFILISMHKSKAFDLSALSFIWDKGSRHHDLSITKEQCTALKNLPPFALSKDGQALQVALACNSKNADAFSTVFREATWKWLNVEFSLSVNRKTNNEQKLALLKRVFAQKNETITLSKHPIGKTKLTILLSPKTQLPPNVLEFTLLFIQSIQSQKDKT